MIVPVSKLGRIGRIGSPSPASRQTPCHCSRVRGITDAASDWKLWALVGLGAVLLWMLWSNTPKAQERAVRLREARRRFRDQVRRIREE